MIFNKDDKGISRKQQFVTYIRNVLKLVKLRDHCHLTGKFRGVAHNRCSLNYKDPTFFPVIFHNQSGYDSHLFIKQLGKLRVTSTA